MYMDIHISELFLKNYFPQTGTYILLLAMERKSSPFSCLRVSASIKRPVSITEQSNSQLQDSELFSSTVTFSTVSGIPYFILYGFNVIDILLERNFQL